MRALVVGAGAVGQVFARHLALGGAEVSFLVKEKYAEEARRGFTLYPLNRKPFQAVRFEGFGVLTSAAEVAKQKWDQVYCTVSSTALRGGDWVAELAGAIGGATWISLQPGLHDHDYVAGFMKPEQIVPGLISLISYHAPLPGETRFPQPGMAYWFPPAGPSPFSGPRERADAVVAALKQGAMPAKRARDVQRAAVLPSAVLNALVLALEGAGWSFAEMKRGDWLRLAARVAREAAVVNARELGMRPPLRRFFVRPWLLRIVMWLAPKIVPLDVETYFKVHFTKVNDQMRLGLKEHVEAAAKLGVPAGALGELSRRLKSG